MVAARRRQRLPPALELRVEITYPTKEQGGPRVAEDVGPVVEMLLAILVADQVTVEAAEVDGHIVAQGTAGPGDWLASQVDPGLVLPVLNRADRSGLRETLPLNVAVDFDLGTQGVAILVDASRDTLAGAAVTGYPRDPLCLSCHLPATRTSAPSTSPRR